MNLLFSKKEKISKTLHNCDMIIKMKERYINFNYLSFTLISLFRAAAFSLPSPGDPACRLDFTTFPYIPIGGCTDVHESLNDWNGYPKSSCCQHALPFFARALALHAARDPPGAIFPPRSLWRDCSGPILLQPHVSIHTCGFDEFYYGSSRCSTIHVTRIDRHVVERCSRFGSSSFDDACGNCASAIKDEVGNLLADLGADEGSDVEEAVCRVAVIVVVMAEAINRTAGIDGGDLERCLPALSGSEPDKYIKLNDGVSGALLAFILMMLGLVAAIKGITKKINKEKEKNKTEDLSKELTTHCSGLYRFTKDEIKNAMRERKLLGRGSAGQVYSGVLPSGQPVAIKKLFQSASSASDSFMREIDGLSRVRHLNLVCLFGCCVEDGEQYLVYEYCPNGNLAQHLLSEDCVLTWKLRVRILRDCAAAVRYLHYHMSGCIVHRDFKLTNILLGHDLVAKLSDFGLAKMLGMEESKVFTDVRGTIGYMDPEYIVSAKLTCSSDIYSFGIVALQLLSGQRVFELDLNARDQLTRKAKDVNAGLRPLSEFKDPRMKDVNDLDFESILQIAVLCTASSSRGRPTIDLIFDEMERAFRNTPS